MALFVKKTNTNSITPLYSRGLQKTLLVVGLGNIGKEYAGTRHNIGFACIDYFAKHNDADDWVLKKDLHCHFTQTTIADTRVIFIKPTTLMNNSGQAVQAVQHFYKIPNTQTLVLHDELDIPFGQIRSRVGGSAAGNNGVKSLISHLGEDFARIRIGIGSEISAKANSADFVLGKFTKAEQTQLPKLEREVSTVISEYLATSKLSHDTRSFLS